MTDAEKEEFRKAVYREAFEAGAKAQLAALDEYERHSGKSERREYSKSTAIKLYPGEALFVGPHEPIKWDGQNETP